MSPSEPSLGIRGAAMWGNLQERFEWDAHEEQMLLEACRTLDTIDALATVIAAEGSMTTGSMGQPVVHPAVAEMRQQQQSFARLASQLSIEDAEFGAVKSARAASSRAAAQKRWRDLKGARNATA